MAHVTVTPTRATPGADVLLTFVVPNEDARSPIGGVLLRPPAGFHAEAAQGPPGWRLEHVGRELAWSSAGSGAQILPGQFATFGLTGAAPQRAQTLVFAVGEILRNGRLPRYHPRVVVAAPVAPATRDRGARTLGKAALVVALAAAVVALAAFFLTLALWLRGPEALQERKRTPVVPSDE